MVMMTFNPLEVKLTLCFLAVYPNKLSRKSIFKVQKQPLNNKTSAKIDLNFVKVSVKWSLTLDLVEREALSSVTRHRTDRCYFTAFFRIIAKCIFRSAHSPNLPFLIHHIHSHSYAILPQLKAGCMCDRAS